MTNQHHKPHVIHTLDWREFLCGWGSAFINITVTFPINKVMFRQMLHGMHTKTAFNQLRSEGFHFLYRGILPPLCQKTISVSIMFGMYSHYQGVLEARAPDWNVQTRKSVSAAAAGLTEAVLAPFERVQMLLQDQHYHQRFRNTAHAFSTLSHYGLPELYRGLTPILLRNSLSNVLFFGLRDVISHRMPKTGHWSSKLLSDFVCGALVGAFISTVFYPVNIVKTHMQCTVGGPFHSLWRTSRIVYEERDRSFRKMFYGVHVNYTRALISWGIINASYELLRSFLDHRPYIHWCYFFRSIIINLFLIIRSGEIAFVLLSGVAEKKICGHLSTFFWFQKPSTFFFIVKLHHYIVLLKDGEIKLINFSSDLFFCSFKSRILFSDLFLFFTSLITGGASQGMIHNRNTPTEYMQCKWKHFKLGSQWCRPLNIYSHNDFTPIW